MQKIKQLSFVLFVFSVLAMSYLGTSAYAQEDIVCEEGQFDRSLACDPTTGTCCNQCDPGGACEANPHTVPCCEDWTQGGNAGLDPGSNRRSSGPAANAGLDPRINTGSSVPAANATFRKDVPIAKPGKRELVRPQKSGHMKQNVHANEGQRQKPTSRSRNQGNAMPSREGGSINNNRNTPDRLLRCDRLRAEALEAVDRFNEFWKDWHYNLNNPKYRVAQTHGALQVLTDTRGYVFDNNHGSEHSPAFKEYRDTMRELRRQNLKSDGTLHCNGDDIDLPELSNPLDGL